MPQLRRATMLATLLLCTGWALGWGLGWALCTPAAVADPTGSPEGRAGRAYPTQDQVDQAWARAARKAQDVSVIETRLLLADRRLQAATVRAEQASEAYNGALWRLQQAKASTRAAQQEADRARRTVSRQRDHIGALVAQSYQNGGDLSAVHAMVSADGPEGVLDQYAAFQGASSSLQADYQRFAATDSLAEVYETEAHEAEAEQGRRASAARHARAAAASAAESAQSVAATIAAEKNRLTEELARAQGVSVALARSRQAALEEIARRQAAERARRAAVAKAQAEAAAQQAARDQAAGRPPRAGGGAPAPQPAPRPAPQPAPAPDPLPAPQPAPLPIPDPLPLPDPGPPPAPGGGAERAVLFAEAQLGEPYRWGAAGPDSWDCSGLTMAAWGTAGRSLPHYSVAQYLAGVPISVADLRPGDLVFWSSTGSPGGIHHVAMYIGGGQIIHAPRTGRPVEIDSMYYWIPPDFFVRV